MKIVEFLRKENCIASLRSDVKEDVLKELTDHLVSNGDIDDSERIYRALLDREKLGSTGIGDHIAIPHAKIKGVQSLVAAFGISDSGIEYHAVDDKPVRLVFLLLASENSTGAHLKALARISRLLKSGGFRERLGKAETTEEMFQLIQEEDNKLV